MWSSLHSFRLGASFALLSALIWSPQIASASPYRVLGDNRVMLFNDDDSVDGIAPIEGQTLNDTNWTIISDYSEENDSFNLQPGTSFRYPKDGSGVTRASQWQLNNVRIGNVFNSTGIQRNSEMCYLPWNSTTSYCGWNRNQRASTQRFATTLVMRNSKNSYITSPRFDDGIGCIYFDAVNSSVADENILSLTVTTFNEEGETLTSAKATVDVYAIVNGKVDLTASQFGVTEITLNSQIGGGIQNYFRIRLNDSRFNNYRGPAQFTIRREEDNGDGVETIGMAIVDNIICSRPAARAVIEPMGTYDASRAGLQTLGWAKTFQNEDLPYFGETGLIPQAKITYAGFAEDLDSTTAENATFHYRWRYLTQAVDGVVTNETVSSMGPNSREAELSGAVLHIPAFDHAYTNIYIKINAITLGNLLSAEEIQYLQLNGQVSKVLNGTGKATNLTTNPDGSYTQRFEFESLPDLRADTDYSVKFLDKDGVEISLAKGVRVVRTAEFDSSDLALRVPKNSTVPEGYDYLLASVEFTHNGGFYTIPMTIEGGTNLVATTAIPAEHTAQPGDIEYYVTAELNAPYYEYVEYAGVNNGFTVASPSESLSTEDYRREFDGAYLPSGGHDYFVRLRDGKTSLRDFDIEVRLPGKNVDPEVVEGYLAGDYSWRVVFATRTNSVYYIKDIKQDPCQIRFRSVDANMVTNYYAIERDAVSSAMTLVPQTAGDECWYDWRFDCDTGYMLFTFSESDSVATMVHADYQNFNGWSDANRGIEQFVGSYSEDKSTTNGVSNAQRTYASDFAAWNPSVATNNYWSEYFNFLNTPAAGMYTDFQSATTPNGLSVENGQWVYQQYQSAGTGYAAQLKGGKTGKGSLILQLTEKLAPRGVDTVTYGARMAQTIEFSDFAYYHRGAGIGDATELQNYTITAHVATELNGGEDHDGCATMSIVAYYAEENGCYEGRLTETSQDNYELAIYRWTWEGDRYDSELLNHSSISTKNFTPKARSASAKYPIMFLSCTNLASSVRIQVGVTTSAESLGASENNRTYTGITYEDANSVITEGSFGFLTSNSPGRFMRPKYFPRSVAAYNNWTKVFSSEDEGIAGTELKASFSAKSAWTSGEGRMQTYETENQNNWGIICSTNLAQEIVLYLAPIGTSAFTPVATNKVTSFTTSTTEQFVLHYMDDCAVKLSPGDKDVDLILSSFELRQWRGESYTDGNQSFPEGTDGRATNIVFTTCWIHGDTNTTERSVEMNTERARDTDVVSIRSPLMDGATGSFARGTGLGMLAFAFTNASENVNVLIQIATNSASNVVNANQLNSITLGTTNSVYWTTVTNFTYEALSEMDGVCTYYLGLHGVTGLMRIALAKADETSDEPARIFLTQVVFRDEPALDLTSWTGYNLRTGDFRSTPTDHAMQFLGDGSYNDVVNWGMSVMLNNSVRADVDEMEAPLDQHVPYVQTPTFDAVATNISVGAISLKARRYDTASDAIARITLYGATSGDAPYDGSQWHKLTAWDIPNNLYTNFTFKLSPSLSGYKSFRLAVKGVSGAPQMDNGDEDDAPSEVVRVAFDEVLVSEGVYAKMAFRNVYCIRDNLETKQIVGRYGDKTEQPLVGESWGVECEVFASQLPEEIRWDKPINVTLHYLKGSVPWGYDNWKNQASSGKLVMAEGVEPMTRTNVVFRSSYADGDASIVPPSTEYEEVQYMLEVEYYTIDSDTVPVTNVMTSADWEKPSWYAGIDFNADLAAYGFSAYNILDTVPFGWAWINEVNIFGGYENATALSGNKDNDQQYIEIAIPAETDLSKWQLQFVTRDEGAKSVATFGENGVAATKQASETSPMASNCVFMVLSNEQSKDSITNSLGNVDVDGVWSYPVDGTVWKTSGNWTPDMYPAAIRLVRPSGIIEHEVTCIGTNLWMEIYGPEDEDSIEYSPRGYADELIAAGDVVVVAGDDMIDGETSLSVLANNGAADEDWHNDVAKTPGMVNMGQYINPEHPVANGDTIIVYCYVDTTGHIRQTVGALTESTESALLLLKRGGEGTNIVYSIDKWYELASITTNGIADVNAPTGRTISVEYTAGVNVSNTLTIVANSQIETRLRDTYGLTNTNRFTDAVVDWLGKGVTAKGEDFAGEDISTNNLAVVLDYHNATNVIGHLTLTEMYWFDMDPTTNGWYFTCALTSAAPNKITREYNNQLYTNDVVSAYLCISNAELATAYAPYILRSDVPGVTSWDVIDNPYTYGEISNVNMKVEANLGNGKRLKDAFVPVRWMLFKPDSFTEDFVSEIEIWDPYSDQSPAGNEGWKDEEHNENSVFYRLNINASRGMYGLEHQLPTNFYEKVSTP